MEKITNEEILKELESLDIEERHDNHNGGFNFETTRYTIDTIEEIKKRLKINIDIDKGLYK